MTLRRLHIVLRAEIVGEDEGARRHSFAPASSVPLKKELTPSPDRYATISRPGRGSAGTARDAPRSRA
jgi:hypothetical protein